MLFLDIDHLSGTLNLFPFTHTQLPSLGWFRRADYHGNACRPLGTHIREFIHSQTGSWPQGKIFLLTHLRYWGMVMNPISIFYCYDVSQQDELKYVVLQVTNTPWKEKILYLLNPKAGNKKHAFCFKKQMHVSPFNPMDMDYQCYMNTPANRLLVHLENHRREERHTDATLILSAKPLTARSLIMLVCRFPHETVKVFFGIYWNAVKLWRKKAPFYSHPDKVKSV